MIKIYEKGIDTEKILNREIQSYTEYEGTVKEIIADVLSRGDEAVLDYCRKFDCPTLDSLLVTQAEIDEAEAQLEPEFFEILKEAKENIEFFHKNQLKDGFSQALRVKQLQTLHRDLFLPQ